MILFLLITFTLWESLRALMSEVKSHLWLVRVKEIKGIHRQKIVNEMRERRRNERM